ncbi:assimilatory sulfite reductase (NADPH) flavoprotein subunit [Ferrimonas balearica]|uniref:assimilatory sulfite reductase (NADPH) flavoprotein subunit n=1 Tax=Ferrimonas balearica TaxID=44012 RepID=UPI001C9A0E22|nr:assimilatory sulfite reductase (NADPH) flavoprotein subunit [Ferrimonas balearica]MBY5921566.1 assimilatory sulfite reductase (NADPH) flavoprotein subunit [Ferrimonas balearica]MBY5995094.1 assimilatory sulfite reductase (NADPH) flavoprotein subunit [Ferrimonas balearica]
MLLKEFEAGAGMLAPEQIQTLRALASELNPVQAAWISGYLAAVANQGAALGSAAAAPATGAQSAVPLTVLYGSQTGNSRSVATALADKARAQGAEVTLISMADYKPRQLKSERQLLVVVSTHGEGDPPDDAIAFHKFLFSNRAPKLPELNYSVLALGDASYDHFCQTGKEFDLRLAELGANRLAERVDCDVDFEDAAEQWQSEVISKLETSVDSAAPTASVVPINGPASYSRSNPYSASLLASQKITGRGSIKDTRHVEISLEGSGLTYQPGDSLGIWMNNDADLVTRILKATGLSGEERVSLKGEETALRQALTDTYELTLLHPALVQGWAELSGDPELQRLVADSETLKAMIPQNQLVDLVTRYPATPSAEQLVGLLRKLTPRLYSIASSQSEVEEEVHLTVALVADERDGEERLGTVSGALARRLAAGDEVKVYVEPNANFRLPEQDSTPVIMIGPGTGIAPFRAFMQERDARGAEGDNWLFFGNPTFTEDFLYQVEWQGYVKSGLLTRIDLAFSRDQSHKIYVQDRIREQGAELFAWLERGAHLYLCGDAERMAKDVEAALVAVIAEHGGHSEEAAQSYLTQLREAKRYQKDVY